MIMFRLLKTYPKMPNIKTLKEFRVRMRQASTFAEALANLVRHGINHNTYTMIDPNAVFAKGFVTPPTTPDANGKRKHTKRKGQHTAHQISTSRGERLQKNSVSKKKAIRFRRQKWSSEKKGTLTKLRLDASLSHRQINCRDLKTNTAKVAKDPRGRCIVCCSECMAPHAHKKAHKNPWGMKTVWACETCGEFLCLGKPKLQGKTCWDVWHSEEQLPTFSCGEAKQHEI